MEKQRGRSYYQPGCHGSIRCNLHSLNKICLHPFLLYMQATEVKLRKAEKKQTWHELQNVPYEKEY